MQFGWQAEAAGITFAAYSHRLGLVAAATATANVTVYGFEHLQPLATIAQVRLAMRHLCWKDYEKAPNYMWAARVKGQNF
jgi:hypothetical protein